MGKFQRKNVTQKKFDIKDIKSYNASDSTVPPFLQISERGFLLIRWAIFSFSFSILGCAGAALRGVQWIFVKTEFFPVVAPAVDREVHTDHLWLVNQFSKSAWLIHKLKKICLHKMLYLLYSDLQIFFFKYSNHILKNEFPE